MVLTTVCRVGARMGRTSIDGCHVDATPSTLWLKVYPPACHPCKVLTSFTTLKHVHFSLHWELWIECALFSRCWTGPAAVGRPPRCLAPTHTDRPCALQKKKGPLSQASPFFRTQQGRSELALGRGDGLYIYITFEMHECVRHQGESPILDTTRPPSL